MAIIIVATIVVLGAVVATFAPVHDLRRSARAWWVAWYEQQAAMVGMASPVPVERDLDRYVERDLDPDPAGLGQAEATLVAQLLQARLTREQYQRRLAALAAVDDQLHPLSVPPAT